MRAVDRPIGCGPRIDRSGNAAAKRLEAVIARIARRESDTRETRERAQRIRRDILVVARRIRGRHVHIQVGMIAPS